MFKARNLVNFSATIISMAMLVVCAAHFYVLFYGETDLSQMHRILLIGAFLGLGIVGGSIAFIQLWRHGIKYFYHNGYVRSLVFAAVFSGASMGIALEYRLADAFRHTYASALVAYYSSPRVAQALGNLVELTTAFRDDQTFNTAMDQCNNATGREIGLQAKTTGQKWTDVERRIENDYKEQRLIMSKREAQEILTCYKERFPQEQTIIADMTDLMARRHRKPVDAKL